MRVLAPSGSPAMYLQFLLVAKTNRTPSVDLGFSTSTIGLVNSLCTGAGFATCGLRFGFRRWLFFWPAVG
jgi:hypothetical protein